VNYDHMSHDELKNVMEKLGYGGKLEVFRNPQSIREFLHLASLDSDEIERWERGSAALLQSNSLPTRLKKQSEG